MTKTIHKTNLIINLGDGLQKEVTLVLINRGPGRPVEMQLPKELQGLTLDPDWVAPDNFYEVRDGCLILRWDLDSMFLNFAERKAELRRELTTH
jgi:hypothetical protein